VFVCISYQSRDIIQYFCTFINESSYVLIEAIVNVCVSYNTFVNCTVLYCTEIQIYATACYSMLSSSAIFPLKRYFNVH